MYSFGLVFSVVFALVASAMAYMTTYIEYEKHKFPKKRLRKESLNAAVFTFVTLLIIWLIAFYFIVQIVTQK